MFTIHLNNMHFFAHHGLHEEETLAGNGFVVDLKICFLPNYPVQELADTINYVQVYELLNIRMEQPVRLLETLAEKIVADIRQLDDRIKKISININKLNPPITRFSGTVGVTLDKEF
ncbi:MAG: dihydroneopterin aldolase [Chitinophagaceae bacterium]|nr:dihydroneopterin aldolase [Bacteroidota bacterium]MCC6257683.1 dihydroneopterin aldolase [Chitinophagaceae bacterium]MCW5917446.1 dihydroneopterin aldolase [Ferruginibacter sp.]